MNKSLALVLTFIMLLAIVPFSAFSASAETLDGLTYTITDGEVTITDCDASLTSIVIPDEIEGLPVTSIGDYAFMNCSKFTSVKIPDTVTSIGSFGFAYCSNLTSITLPKSLTTMGGNTFCSTNLSSIKIPESLSRVGSASFENCKNLKAVYITDLEAWYNIDFLDYRANPLFVAKKLYLNNQLLTNLVITEGTTSISNFAFAYCESITSVTIPKSITTIGNGAFEACTKLTSVYISDLSAWCNIDFIPYYESNPLVFARNLYLNNELVTDLVIPDGIKSVKTFAFRGCESLTSVTFPNSLTSIDMHAFSKCKNLTSVIIPEGVTSIGDCAFDQCENLINIELPSSLNSIGKSAFAECSYLKSIVIPEGVTSIGDNAFEHCTILSSITLPVSVTSIGDSAFQNSSWIEDVWYGGNVSDKNNIAFGPDNEDLLYATWHYKPCTGDHIYSDCNDTLCNNCEASRDAVGHDDGEWKTLDDGSQELRCTVCGELLDSKDALSGDVGLLGDINNDGKINQYDYILAKRIHFKNYTPTTEETARGDVNNDGKNDQYDYILIKRHHFKNYTITGNAVIKK